MQDSVTFGLEFADKRTENRIRSVVDVGAVNTGGVKEIEAVVIVPAVGKTGRAVFAHHINDVIRVGKRADIRRIEGFLHTLVSAIRTAIAEISLRSSLESGANVP